MSPGSPHGSVLMGLSSCTHWALPTTPRSTPQPVLGTCRCPSSGQSRSGGWRYIRKIAQSGLGWGQEPLWRHTWVVQLRVVSGKKTPPASGFDLLCDLGKSPNLICLLAVKQG